MKKCVWLFHWVVSGSVMLVSGAFAQGWYAPAYSTFRDIAPIQLYAVPEISVEPPIPLPEPGATPDGQTAATVEVQPDRGEVSGDNVSLNMSNLDFSANPRSDTLGSLGQALSAARIHTGLHWSKTARMPDTPSQPSWFSTPQTDTWSLGAQNWNYTGSEGLGLTLGNDLSNAPVWGNAARLGGIGIHQAPLNSVSQGGDPWQYSTMVGALNYSTDNTEDGGLIYGPAASNSVIQYALDPQFTLESQVQWAPDLLTTGIGGKYKTQDWGVWSAGVANASQAMQRGWRYQLGYAVQVMDMVKLSWVNEQRSNGFADLASYRDLSADAIDAARTRNQWGATLPLGRWGDLSGTYEQIDDATGMLEQRVGLAQKFWYSPSLSVQLRADREIISGNYDIGVSFGVPIN